MRRRLKILIFVLLGLALAWVLGDWVYSSMVAAGVKKWEDSIERDDQGVQKGCRQYTIGNGETAVLLIHGINDSPACYHKMAPVLAEEGFTCRVMRLPGFAEPIERYAKATKEQWLAAVKREIDSLREDHPQMAVIAHSLGGAVMIAHLLADPEAADAVVLLAPAVAVSSRRSPVLPVRFWHEIGKRLLIFTDITSSPFSIDCHDPTAADYPGRTRFTPIEIVDQTFQLVDHNHGRADEFTTPLMMVLSEEDKVIDSQAAEEFYQQAASEQKEVVFVDNCGHMPQVDTGWESLTRRIATFLRAKS